MDCYIIGVGMTGFGKRPDDDHRTLARDALLLALGDAGLDDGQPID